MRRRTRLYDHRLKAIGRRLRKTMTESEQQLWQRIRGQQIMGVAFYRQRPIGRCVVDFFAPRANLVIEVDGSQHRLTAQQQRDGDRDAYLRAQGLEVLRFDNRQVLLETDAVVLVIAEKVGEAVKRGNPP